MRSAYGDNKGPMEHGNLVMGGGSVSSCVIAVPVDSAYGEQKWVFWVNLYFCWVSVFFFFALLFLRVAVLCLEIGRGLSRNGLLYAGGEKD